MVDHRTLGQEAVRVKGWFRAHRWLILRRLSQLSVFGLFLIGPLAGVWLIKGNLSSSLILDSVPLTEPIVFLQMLAAGFVPAGTAILGFLLVVFFYWLVGGRAYCSWVCPINPLTDAAYWLRERLGLRGGAKFSRQLRLGVLAMVLLLAALTGSLAYETFNPVSIVQRELIFGLGFAWSLLLAIFFLDLLVAKRAWCSHLCPMGTLYGLLGKASLLRVRADWRAACDDCMECFAVCPESQVIKPALKGATLGQGPVVLSGDCTNCGRCIDICGKEVFAFGWRFNNQERPLAGDRGNRPSAGVL